MVIEGSGAVFSWIDVTFIFKEHKFFANKQSYTNSTVSASLLCERVARARKQSGDVYHVRKRLPSEGKVRFVVN